MNINFLRIPLTMLYGMVDIDSFTGLPPENVALLQKDYSPAELEAIREALKYATANPGFDFKAQFPELAFSNRQIYDFLVKIHHSIEGTGKV